MAEGMDVRVRQESGKVSPPGGLKELNECHSCKPIGKSVNADYFCNECAQYLCKLCKKCHKKDKTTKKHHLVSVSSEKSGYSSAIKEHEGLKENEKTRLSFLGTFFSKKSQKQGSDETINLRQNEEQSNKRLEHTGTKMNVPGKPKPYNIRGDSITLSWDPPSTFGDEDYYQVSYKEIDHEKRWKVLQSEFRSSTAVLRDLKSNTTFIFRVRAVYEDGEGPYSEESVEIHTPNSPALKLLNDSLLKEKGNPSPSKFALPITEIREARNQHAKTRKFEIGAPSTTNENAKTIMLVGATGTGKSTLVDGIVNYVLGVNWEDSFRFTVIDLEQEEKHKVKNQAISQTEWITCYTLYPEKGSRLTYPLNIIDTPGFGDTRGLERDQEIVEQIRQLFSQNEPKGVIFIDAVCFLVKAPDARLTAIQSYIFQSIMSLFGVDIEHNICSIVTFADGIDPPVLAALKVSGLPFGDSFTFNNSGLFAKNAETRTNSLSPMFWDMGVKSFRAFFDHLDQVETKSLQLTKNVLNERYRLEATVNNLQPQLDAGLVKINSMKLEIEIIEQNKALIQDNKDFEYEVEETRQKKIPLPPGLHVTNCIHCNFTCHENCKIANDSEKARCSAMEKDGYCKACPGKCNWTKHVNTPYIFKYNIVKVKKTYAKMQKKYKEATGKLLSQEQIVARLGEELKEPYDIIEQMMYTINVCNDRIKEIALRPNPLTMTEHIDVMIENEKLEQKDGFMQRINILNDFRKKAQLPENAKHFKEQADTTLNDIGKNWGVMSMMSTAWTWLSKNY